MSLRPEQRLARARMSLMSHKTWCLYSGLLMVGKLEVKPLPMKTAATNGRDVFFDPDFVGSLGEEQLRFVLLHENEHKALRQLSTYKFLFDKNHQVANMAADYVVNVRLLDADRGEGFIAMPSMGLLDHKYRGWTTKQVFDDLMEQGKDKEPRDGLDEHDVEGAEALSEEEKESLKKEVEAAIRQGALLAGQKSGDASRDLMGTLDSQIRWQEILAEFVKDVTKGKDDVSWARVDSQWVSAGLYLPSLVSEQVGRLMVGIDASGSTWMGNQLEGFCGELIAIAEECQPEGIDVVWWDTSVQSVQSFTPETYSTMSLELQIKGGGGTAPSCVTSWMAEQKDKHYAAAIMLSDGLVGNDWGNWELPVLWCLNNKHRTSPVGQTLYIGE